MKMLLAVTFAFGVLVLLGAPAEAAALLAQPPPPAAPAAVPIDGGLGLLALAGGAYAAKRLRARSRDDEA